MAHLLYFWEGRQAAGAADIEAAGLGYALAGGFSRAELRGQGPGKSPGLVMSRGSRPEYRPDAQRWINLPSLSGQRLWCGAWTSSPATPAELERPSMLAGHVESLADGQEWLVPCAYEWRESDDRFLSSPSLPAYSELADGGNWIRGEVRPEYRRLWEIAQFAWDAWYGDGASKDVRVGAEDCRNLAAEVLSVNYRVTKYELSLLRVFDDPPAAALRVLAACTGQPAVTEWLKKKERAASGTVSGISGDAA